MLKIQDIRQSFRVGFWLKEVEILHGFSFEVEKNSIFGLLGANGAGKTTLIHLIAGLRKPKSGSIQIGGFESATNEAKKLIGYLPERPYFHDHLTGEGVLRYMGRLSGMDGESLEKRIPLVLEWVGLKHARKKELKTYSKGMLQRIGIAQAILHDPELLILDEPTSGLDPVGRREMRELVFSLAKAGKTIFFSSHIIPDVERICEKVALIEKGNLIQCGRISEFFKDSEKAFEIEVSGTDKKKLKALDLPSKDLQILDDKIRMRLKDQEDMNAALQKLLRDKSGVRVEWAKPVEPSLEDLFGQDRFGEESFGKADVKELKS